MKNMISAKSCPCETDFSESQGQQATVFEEGTTYLYTMWSRGIKTSLPIEIVKRLGNFLEIVIDGHLNELVPAVPFEQTEFLTFPLGWPIAGEKIFPYRRAVTYDIQTIES